MTTPTDLPALSLLVKGWADRIETVRNERRVDSIAWAVLHNVEAEMRVLVAATNGIVAGDNVAESNVTSGPMCDCGFRLGSHPIAGCPREVFNCRRLRVAHEPHWWGPIVSDGGKLRRVFVCCGEPTTPPMVPEEI
jgi:hypothetical protein